MAKGDEYKAYPKGITAERAAEYFQSKYGYPPAEVVDGGTIWLVGPLKGKGQGSLVKRAEAARREMTPERARQLVLELEAAQ